MYKLIYMDRVSQYKTVHNEALSLFTKKNRIMVMLLQIMVL